MPHKIAIIIFSQLHHAGSSIVFLKPLLYVLCLWWLFISDESLAYSRGHTFWEHDLLFPTTEVHQSSGCLSFSIHLTDLPLWTESRKVTAFALSWNSHISTSRNHKNSKPTHELQSHYLQESTFLSEKTTEENRAGKVVTEL